MFWNCHKQQSILVECMLFIFVDIDFTLDYYVDAISTDFFAYDNYYIFDPEHIFSLTPCDNLTKKEKLVLSVCIKNRTHNNNLFSAT